MTRKFQPGEEFDQSRRTARMERIDAMPQELRMLIKEEGLTIVQAFLDLGVSKPRHIRHLITTVRNGSFDGGVNPLQREKHAKASA